MSRQGCIDTLITITVIKFKKRIHKLWNVLKLLVSIFFSKFFNSLK